MCVRVCMCVRVFSALHYDRVFLELHSREGAFSAVSAAIMGRLGLAPSFDESCSCHQVLQAYFKPSVASLALSAETGTEGDIALHFLVIKLQSKVVSEVTRLLRVGSQKENPRRQSKSSSFLQCHLERLANLS